MPTTIYINNLGVRSQVSSFILTSVTRSDNGNPPSGISLPYVLAEGSPTGSPPVWPWTGSFTDNSPPPFYNALGTINGLETGPLVIPGVGSPVPTPTPVPTFTPVSVAQSSTPTWQFPYVDSDGNAISLTGKTVRFVAWYSVDGGATKVDLFTHDNASVGGITITGAGSNLVNVALTASDTGTLLANGANYNLVDATDGVVISFGPYSIIPAQFS